MDRYIHKRPMTVFVEGKQIPGIRLIRNAEGEYWYDADDGFGNHARSNSLEHAALRLFNSHQAGHQPLTHNP